MQDLSIDQPVEAEPDQWTARFEADNGTVVYGDAAIAAMVSHGLQAQEQHRRAVQAMTPLQLHLYEKRLRTGRRPARRAGNVLIFPQRRERRARQRRRRAQAARSSAASGDSPEGEPDPPGWRWASPAGWESFIASVNSRDFEREVALERWHGVGR